MIMHAQASDIILVNFTCKPILLLSILCSQRRRVTDFVLVSAQDVHKKKGHEVIRELTSQLVQVCALPFGALMMELALGNLCAIYCPYIVRAYVLHI